MTDCLSGNDSAGWIKGVQDNHWLLAEIGVVPKKVGQFIKDVMTAGGVGKVCGAGSIRGDAGGMVMVYGIDDVSSLCQSFGYETFDVQGGAAGVDVL